MVKGIYDVSRSFIKDIENSSYIPSESEILSEYNDLMQATLSLCIHSVDNTPAEKSKNSKPMTFNRFVDMCNKYADVDIYGDELEDMLSGGILRDYLYKCIDDASLINNDEIEMNPQVRNCYLGDGYYIPAWMSTLIDEGILSHNFSNKNEFIRFIKSCIVKDEDYD